MSTNRWKSGDCDLGCLRLGVEPDWTQKTAGRVFEDLVFRRWWTDETATSDAEGSATVRAFHGAYEIAVTADDECVTETVQHLGAAPGNMTIVMP